MNVLLLAGGSGTRLWPLSTRERPKQFLPLLSSKSLIAETYARVVPLGDVYVATARQYEPLVRTQLPDLPRARIFLEPARRNTGPALLAAALELQRRGDSITAAVASDQTVADAVAFRRALTSAARAARSATVVVLAVTPTRPESDFGYLELTRRRRRDIRGVIRFVEKPSSRLAAKYVAAGYLWNAGIFVFRPSRLLEEAARVAPSLLAGVERYVASLARSRAVARRAYEELPAVSIDHAVMEKAAGVRAVELTAGWSDVGTWRSVRDLRGASDAHGNLFLAETPILAPGVRDSAVVVSRDGVLVLPFAREGELRIAVEGLKSRKASSPGSFARRSRASRRKR